MSRVKQGLQEIQRTLEDAGLRPSALSQSEAPAEQPEKTQQQKEIEAACAGHMRELRMREVLLRRLETDPGDVDVEAGLGLGRENETSVDEQPQDERLSFAVMEHLGPGALAGGKMSVLDAFTLGWQAAKRDALTQAPQERAAVTDKQIDDKVFCLGIQAYAYVDDPAGYRELVRSFISLAQSSEGKTP
jgi:hypothetical protein